MDAPQSSDLRAALAAVPDPRRRRGQRSAWPVLLTLIAAALVSGQQGMRAIGQWVAEPAGEFGPLLDRAPGRVPSTATRRRAARAVDLAALEAQLTAFVVALPAPPAQPAAASPPRPWRGLAIDGKAVRGQTGMAPWSTGSVSSVTTTAGCWGSAPSATRATKSPPRPACWQDGTCAAR